jgi:TPR repeat protein
METADAAVQFQQDRLALDKLNAQSDLVLRQRELDLKARELELKASEVNQGKWRSPLTLGIAAALLAGFSSIGVTYLQNKGNQEIARSKAQSDLILESIKTADPTTGKKNLLFFIKARLIDDPTGKISELINADLYPSLPPDVARERAQGKWVPPNGEAPDYPEALKLFLLAANQGDARSMANVGWIYENGLGLPQRDCTKAMEWYKKAVAGGDTIALWNIGRIYDLGCNEFKQDFHEARLWYQKAAVRGWADAANALKKLDADGH